MSDFWAGTLLGFVAGIIAGILMSDHWKLRTRYRAYKAAGKLVGTWVAYNMHGQTVENTPMPGAGLIVISSKPHWWSANSAVLDVCAQDIDPSPDRTRDHEDHIVIDPAFPWLATRIDRHTDSNDISEQRLAISPDFNIVCVFPILTIATGRDAYRKHAWRRQETVPPPS